MNDRKQTIQYKRNVQQYLSELSALCLHEPLENELLSIERTEQIRLASMESLRGKPVRKIQMDFDEKKTPKFKDYVARLYRANPHSIFVWTAKSNSCGLYEISSLLEFNFDFEFSVNDQGIVVLLASNLSDNLVLDFSVDEKLSRQILEVDACGDHWFAINY
jgi:hypothetical protein